MRNTFSNILVKKARIENKLLLLTGDHGYALFDSFKENFPDKFINAGVAEQNMIGVASGLARGGFKPIIYGLSSFVPVRVLEQIKIDLAHDDIPSVLIGDGAGLVYSYLGTSHQSTEDIALTRSIPNLKVFSPADRFELELCMNEAFKFNSSVYLRFGKSDRGDIHTDKINCTLGDPINVYNGSSHITFVSTGSMTKTAVELRNIYYKDVSVYSIPFIKPININKVVEIAKKSNLIITFEEHSVFGGLGSVISKFYQKTFLQKY